MVDFLQLNNQCSILSGSSYEPDFVLGLLVALGLLLRALSVAIVFRRFFLLGCFGNF